MIRPAWTETGSVCLAFWLAYAACFIPEIIGSFFQKSAGADRRQDRGSLGVLVAGTMASLFAAFILALNVPALDMASNGVGMLAIGTAVMTAGVGLRWYAIWVLGRFFTRDVAIREGHRIVREGPYRLLRHPSYAGYLLAMAGIGLALNNWGAMLVMTAVNLGIYSYRMSVEEAALGEAFGDSYAQYRRATKRIIPFVY